jgi:DNA-binding response OmpR family regulator
LSSDLPNEDVDAVEKRVGFACPALCSSEHELNMRAFFMRPSSPTCDDVRMRVLLVEDDISLGTVVQRGLIEEGHAVDHERTLAGAREMVRLNPYHLVVLDLGLPDGDGLVLCRELRESGNPMRVLMLTARDGLGDKVSGLDAGADDYLTKPFDFPELAARARALLRRPEDSRSPTLAASDIHLDPAAHIVRRSGVIVPLTAREFALLHYLMDRKGDVVSRTDLLEAVWDANYDGLSNVVDVHVANLRRKLDMPGNPAPLETIRGVGYRIEP